MRKMMLLSALLIAAPFIFIGCGGKEVRRETVVVQPP
jgi:hypothetical protein